MPTTEHMAGAVEPADKYYYGFNKNVTCLIDDHSCDIEISLWARESTAPARSKEKNNSVALVSQSNAVTISMKTY